MRTDPLRNPEELTRRIYAYVAYRVGDGPNAEDITSDVFERALRYRESFDPAKGAPAAWLIGIARRCLAERPAMPVVSPDDVAEAGTERSLEDDIVENLTLNAAVASLDERDRELVALRYGADLTAKQIAELLELRTNTVEVAIHRALERLRTTLGEDKGEDAPALAVKPIGTRGMS